VRARERERERERENERGRGEDGQHRGENGWMWNGAERLIEKIYGWVGGWLVGQEERK